MVLGCEKGGIRRGLGKWGDERLQGGRQEYPRARGRGVAEDAKIDVTVSPNGYSQGWQPALPAEFGAPSSVVIVSEPDARVVVT